MQVRECFPEFADQYQTCMMEPATKDECLLPTESSDDCNVQVKGCRRNGGGKCIWKSRIADSCVNLEMFIPPEPQVLPPEPEIIELPEPQVLPPEELVDPEPQVLPPEPELIVDPEPQVLPPEPELIVDPEPQVEPVSIEMVGEPQFVE